ncbi:hypothetical protein CKM354_000569200 [Cercospora kikuchii]|uniref:Small ribosomal subunit protein mS35 mitochondrial conserved domain-containing protein n=1 Tax=Cercospora kikuchii TaxID=84275 RepID=A0A9P3FHH0_9PEZI|nr:mitochondrial 37S ribosomal protein RSM24 [Cercospora kikuchii]GIZ42420.1 hypothetical protein CKM354_000569200 [Cercospora kikuchii]
MATPLKRVCRQATQTTSRWMGPSISRASVPRTAQWHQCRPLHQATRSMAQQELAENDLDIYLEALDENLPVESELSSAAHAELDQHRELREMMRLAAWEMPFLAQHAKPFVRAERTADKTPLRWRYTTYFSESHPASRKVVVEFKVKHLGLGPKETEKLKKLAGSRYNPETKQFKMSCESFETIAQNKRYLADTVDKLIVEAKDLETDSFEDVPLDTRHHKFKKRMQFPEEWRMTERRRHQLDKERRKALLAEGRKVEEGQIVSGAAAIEADRQIKLKQAEEAVMAEAKKPLPAGKMGKKQMGQRGR